MANWPPNCLSVSGCCWRCANFCLFIFADFIRCGSYWPSSSSPPANWWRPREAFQVMNQDEVSRLGHLEVTSLTGQTCAPWINFTLRMILSGTEPVHLSRDWWLQFLFICSGSLQPVSVRTQHGLLGEPAGRGHLPLQVGLLPQAGHHHRMRSSMYPRRRVQQLAKLRRRTVCQHLRARRVRYQRALRAAQPTGHLPMPVRLLGRSFRPLRHPADRWLASFESLCAFASQLCPFFWQTRGSWRAAECPATARASTATRSPTASAAPDSTGRRATLADHHSNQATTLAPASAADPTPSVSPGASGPFVPADPVTRAILTPDAVAPSVSVRKGNKSMSFSKIFNFPALLKNRK